jgi:hypothetical protein
MISIAKQRVTQSAFNPFFAPTIENTHNYPILNGLQRVLGKIGDQRAFQRFSPIDPANDVTIQLSLAKTRPDGILRRFNRFPPRLRTTAPGLKVGH